jgi:hypothetical protein
LCPRFESGWGRLSFPLTSGVFRFPDGHTGTPEPGAIPRSFRATLPTARSGVLAFGDFQHRRVPLHDLDAGACHGEPVSVRLSQLGMLHQPAQHLRFGIPPERTSGPQEMPRISTGERQRPIPTSHASTAPAGAIVLPTLIGVSEWKGSSKCRAAHPRLRRSTGSRRSVLSGRPAQAW